MRHFNKEKGTGNETHPAIVSGIVTGPVPVSYWLNFSWSLVTIPEVFAKANSAQFPSHVYMANTESREPRRC